jgi:hypothetical protein
VRRHAALRNLPISDFSSERLSRISLAAPKFVGALPRVLEEIDTVAVSSSPPVILPAEPNIEEALCRAALDHIARGFDHVAMVSELLQEALDILETLHCAMKQRRAAWLHAALGNAFSKAEPVSLDLEATRHLDAALKRYEDNETEITNGVATAWAWPRAFLLEHLGCCALRLGDATLCVSVFLKLAHSDMRSFLSDPAVGIAAQRDAVTLLARGNLDSNSDTARLRGFATARFGESRSQLKESKNKIPAKTAIDQGLIEWAVNFEASDGHSQAAIIELRLKIFTSEPLHIKHLEIVFRSHNASQETVIADSKEIIHLDTETRDHSGLLIPGLVYAWRGDATIQTLRCVSAETLVLVLAGTVRSVVASARPRISALFEAGSREKDCLSKIQTKPTIMMMNILLEGPRFVFVGAPTLMIATLKANQPISNHALVVEVSSSSTEDGYFDVTSQLHGAIELPPAYGAASSCHLGGSKCILFDIGNTEKKVVSFWVTCHGNTKVKCMVNGNTISAPGGDMEQETLSSLPEAAHCELTALPPFVVTFEMMKSSMLRDAQIYNLENSEIHWIGELTNGSTLNCCGEKSIKLRCNIQNAQLVPIVIKHVTYKPLLVETMSYKIFPKRDTLPTTLAQHEILAVQFTTPSLNSGMDTLQKLGCLVVCWSPVTKGVISTQIIETCIICPEVLVIQPTISCKLDLPSRAHLCHPLVATWHVKNKTSYPLKLKAESSTNAAFAWASKRGYHVELARRESFPLDMTLIPLYLGNTALSEFYLVAGLDCKKKQTTVFVDPSF